jgi:hypothetical protein
MVCRWVFLKIKFNNFCIFDKFYDLPMILPETHKQKMNEIFDVLFSTEDKFEEYICYLKIIIFENKNSLIY